MEASYEKLLASRALRSFFSLDDGSEAPPELFLILEHIKTRKFAPGDTIIREGDRADSLFIIDRGRADVISESGGVWSLASWKMGMFSGR